MHRLSIARSFRMALIGLTVVLAVIAALGVASLYSARQSYENTLLNSSQVASAASNLATASVVVESLAAHLHGAPTTAERQTALAYQAAQHRALALAASDPMSLRLVAAEANARSADDALVIAARVQTRQSVRQRAAQATARSRSRRALLLILVAGLIALFGAMALVASLIRSLRAPLDALVGATQAMAAGDLDRRVSPAGPLELRQLSTAFNQMGEELAAGTTRLERERSKLATTIASLGDGLIVTEPDLRVIATLNPRAGELIPELAPGTAVDDAGSPLPPRAELDGQERTIEHHGRTLAVTARELGSGDTADGSVWTIRDMTEWARLDRAKSEFIATASHELRSPLTSIKGFVELLANAPGDMSARQSEFVSIVLRSTNRLVDLVNDLLDVARLDAAQVSISPRAVDVGEVLDELAELMGPRLESKHQELTVDVAPSLPPVLADPGRLRQIVQNLLTNAHLYTGDGGRLLMAADARGDQVRINVADTGPGMSPEQLGHIYERFYRAQEDHSSPGTGLGLAIVHSLVDLHGGKIDVASEVGRGTTFRVSLPAALDAEGDPATTPDSSAGRSVLIVARDVLRSELEPALDQLQIAYSWETSGVGAARACRESRFDVALIDVGLSNPQAVLQAISPGGRRLRGGVIFVSADDDPPPPGIERLGVDVVPLSSASESLTRALGSLGLDPQPPAVEQVGSEAER